MNKKLFWTLGLALITSLSMQAQDDDLYFTPSKKKSQDMNATVTSVRSNQQSATTQSSRPALAVYNNNSRDEDEYNRRDINYAGAWQTGGGAEEDSLVARVDTVYVTSPDMYDPETDFIYSRRLLRFHSPRFGFALSSPYYWNLVYGYGVYNYLYDPFYWDLYDPFYWDYGWGYGWSWHPWYSSFYGWHSPYYAWNYWGVGPYWHGGTYYANRFSNSRNRGTFSENRYAGGTVGRSSAVAAANGTRNSFSSRTENAIRTSAARTNVNTRTNVASSNNRVSAAGNTRTVFNGNTVSGNANNNSRVVVVNRNESNNRSSAVRQNTQTTTRTQTPTTTTQQRTAATQNQQRTVVSVPQRTTTTTTTSTPTRSSATTSSFSSGSSTRSSFGGGGSVGGGASSGGARTSAGRR